jgi:hypothetical protein
LGARPSTSTSTRRPLAPVDLAAPRPQEEPTLRNGTPVAMSPMSVAHVAQNASQLARAALLNRPAGARPRSPSTTTPTCMPPTGPCRHPCRRPWPPWPCEPAAALGPERARRVTGAAAHWERPVDGETARQPDTGPPDRATARQRARRLPPTAPRSLSVDGNGHPSPAPRGSTRRRPCPCPQTTLAASAWGASQCT